MTEREIFFGALEKATPEERSAYLDGACGQELGLRRKVEELLKEHFSDDSLLREPGVHEARTRLDSAPVLEGPGTQIGRYKLLQKLGEGGFGVVYMADQKEPVKRRVALKIIKLGMDTEQVLVRGLHDALAQLNRENHRCAQMAASKDRNYLDAISSSGRTLLALINDILDLSKIEAGKLELQYEPVNVARLVEETQKLFSIKAGEKGIKILTELDPKLPRGHRDSFRPLQKRICTDHSGICSPLEDAERACRVSFDRGDLAVLQDLLAQLNLNAWMRRF